MDRRTLLTWLAAGAAGQVLPQAAAAQSAAFRVVIIGGGMAGATAAKYFRLWGGKDISITLIEPRASYISNIMSNKVLTGQRDLASLTFSYKDIAGKYGVKIVVAEATGIDPAARKVACSDGSSQDYDRLIVAPGIAFDYSGIEGMTDEAQKILPHAWHAGPQTELLQKQLAELEDGKDFILTVPKPPYRCPPGPYERACVVADWMKKNKAKSKLVLLDANEPKDASDPYSAILAEPVNFKKAFTSIHTNIEYLPGVSISSVDAAARTIATSAGIRAYGVLNIIPPQKAGRIITDSGIGLANSGDGLWAGVNLLSYESTAHPLIHVIGDSHASGQPKAGHIGNQEAKVCVDAILRLQSGGQPYDKPITNSACYTPITATTATWLTAVFAYDAADKSMKVVGGKAAEPIEGPTRESYKQMEVWFKTLMRDSFA